MSDNYQWLIESRAKSQQLLVELYAFVQANAPALGSAERDAEWSVAGLLIGASFSLWRAVFLSFDADRTKPAAVIERAEKFLKRLIEDNTILYPHDRELKEWTSGYYLNNARYRLQAIVEKLRKSGTAIDDPALVRLSELHRNGIRSAKPTEAWDHFHGATVAAFVQFKTAWMRTGPASTDAPIASQP